MSSAVIFGGAGFVGRHLTQELLSQGHDEVLVADIATPLWDLPAGVRHVPCDVRRPIPDSLDREAALVFNLAAVHRTPGHPDHEYFETNKNGAEHVVQYARRNEVTRLWFTSSIAVYGPSEDPRTERSPLEPESAYGRSKRLAEEIHAAWAHEQPGRHLVTVRPGTVFGPGEGGNFTRLAGALRRRRFVYPGRLDTIKGCGYVTDLVKSLLFMEQFAEPSVTYNFGYADPPTIQQVCEAFCEVGGYPRPMGPVPLPVLLTAAKVLNFAGARSFNPERVMKLVRSTNIVPELLIEKQFPYETDLREALRRWRDTPPLGEFV
jgi:nucleoside-diphosphate-sugar epimerase